MQLLNFPTTLLLLTSAVAVTAAPAQSAEKAGVEARDPNVPLDKLLKSTGYRPFNPDHIKKTTPKATRRSVSRRDTGAIKARQYPAPASAYPGYAYPAAPAYPAYPQAPAPYYPPAAATPYSAEAAVPAEPETASESESDREEAGEISSGDDREEKATKEAEKAAKAAAAPVRRSLNYRFVGRRSVARRDNRAVRARQEPAPETVDPAGQPIEEDSDFSQSESESESDREEAGELSSASDREEAAEKAEAAPVRRGLNYRFIGRRSVARRSTRALAARQEPAPETVDPAPAEVDTDISESESESESDLEEAGELSSESDRDEQADEEAEKAAQPITRRGLNYRFIGRRSVARRATGAIAARQEPGPEPNVETVEAEEEKSSESSSESSESESEETAAPVVRRGISRRSVFRRDTGVIAARQEPEPNTVDPAQIDTEDSESSLSSESESEESGRAIARRDFGDIHGGDPLVHAENDESEDESEREEKEDELSSESESEYENALDGPAA